jgi:hypothetical protein
VGGIVLILYQNHIGETGWTIGAIIFQGAGVFPLLLIQVGYLIITYVLFAGECATQLTIEAARQMITHRTRDSSEEL